jgi:hypothetical protein
MEELMALQCPRCPLRFDLAPMLADHLQTDHALTPEQTQHLQPPALRSGPPPAGERDGPADRPTDPPGGGR